MGRLSGLPTSRPAANERAPRRRPRVRLPLLKAKQLAHQEAFLAFIRAGESSTQAALRTRVALLTVDGWRADDPEFAQLYREAQAEARAVLEGKVDDLLPKAIDVAEETLGDEDAKLKWDAAHKLLKGRGLLRDVDALPVGTVNVVFVIGKGYQDAPKVLEAALKVADGNGKKG